MALSALRIAVIVPSYKRPRDLGRCLAALAMQSRAPEQVLVVARVEDTATWDAARAGAGRLPLTIVAVATTGVVAALNAALMHVAADIVAFTDDDAAPRPEWLARVAVHFAADERLGGLGGRDWIHQHGRIEDGQEAVIGRLSWFGRCIGNHHLGCGPPREVDVLKGVNMAFRAAALHGVRFDERLRGAGAQVGNELGVSLAVKRRGWKLVYDPSVAVDHYPSMRHDDDQRNTFSPAAIRNAVFNETLLLCGHFSLPRRALFMLWALAIGNHASPGIAQWLRLLRSGVRRATARLVATLAGRVDGFRAARR
jgi:cellulose synthase/poly-beta-1,6-N-acetylglucosamine synthase-like glycosyltransferase